MMEILSQVQQPIGSIAYSGTVNIDLSGPTFQSIGDLTGNITIGYSNVPADGSVKTVTAKLKATGALRNLNFDAGITFLGSKPSTLAQNRTAFLSLTAYGSAVYAAYSAEV